MIKICRPSCNTTVVLKIVVHKCRSVNTADGALNTQLQTACRDLHTSLFTAVQALPNAF